MKITRDEIINDKNLIGHLVLNASVSYPSITDAVLKDGEVEINLVVNGEVYDLQDFVDHWQSQVSKMISNKAKELFQERFRSVTDLMCDLEERLQNEVDARLDEWEKES